MKQWRNWRIIEPLDSWAGEILTVRLIKLLIIVFRCCNWTDDESLRPARLVFGYSAAVAVSRLFCFVFVLFCFVWPRLLCRSRAPLNECEMKGSNAMDRCNVAGVRTPFAPSDVNNCPGTNSAGFHCDIVVLISTAWYCTCPIDSMMNVNWQS